MNIYRTAPSAEPIPYEVVSRSELDPAPEDDAIVVERHPYVRQCKSGRSYPDARYFQEGTGRVVSRKERRALAAGGR